MVRTTLTAAMASSDVLATVASVTSISKGQYILVDNEIMLVTDTPNSTALTIPVLRGQSSTIPAIHGSGRVVSAGNASEFTNAGGFTNSLGSANIPAFNQPVSPLLFATTLASTVLTWLPGHLLNGLILHDGTGGISVATPTAALMLQAMPNSMVGGTLRFHLRNTGTGTITVTAGTGATLSGTMTVAANNAKDFVLLWTNVSVGNEAFTLYSLGTVVF